MRRLVPVALVVAVAWAGCSGAQEPPAEDNRPRDDRTDATTPDLPAGRGQLRWSASWDNTTGLARSVEPYGPFIADNQLELTATGTAEAVSINVSTEAETIVTVQPVEAEAWRLVLLHHHHGLTPEDAEDRAAALRTSWTPIDNGTRLDIYVDTADIEASSAGAQIEVYLTVEIPAGAMAALHTEAAVQPVDPPALVFTGRDVCLEKLSLATSGYNLSARYAPECDGALRLVNQGGPVHARLVDDGARAYAGRAVSDGGPVTVDLQGHRNNATTAGVTFEPEDRPNATVAVDVHADAGGGDLRLLGCAHWDCFGGAD